MLIKLKGMNIPRQNKKLPRHVRTNAYSLKGVINSAIRIGLGTGLSRDLTVTLAIRRIIDINNVMQRTVELKPIRPIKLVIIIG